MLAGGVAGARWWRCAVAELPAATPRPPRCLELRERLGFAAGAGGAGVRDARRRAAGRRRLARWLRMARLVRTSLEANGGICRSLLEFRHNLR